MKRAVSLTLILLLVIAGVLFRAQLAAFGRGAYATITPRLAAISHRLSAGRSPQPAISNALTASGTLEAPTLDIASTAGGRIARLHVSEGQQVTAGDLIAEMDTTLLDAEIRQAEAAKTVTEAQLAQLKAGAREADLAVARAAVTQAEAAKDAALAAWQDAQALVNAPNDLDVQIVQAATAVEAVQEQMTAAQAAATAADLEQALWGRTVKSLEEGFDVQLPIAGGGTKHVDAPADRLGSARLQWNLASQGAWASHAKASAAAVTRDAARQTLTDLRSQRADPQALRAQADMAGALDAVAEAAVETAQANVAVIQAGVPSEQIAAAQAQVDQAGAAIQPLVTRRAQTRIIAPRGGVVTSVIRRAGEVTAPGGPIVSLADLENVTLTVYVPETQLGQVQLGSAAQVTVDSLPGQIFEGLVQTIGDRAEFTPKNVQTREERTNLVFPVKISLPKTGGLLKPGMPADASLGDTGTGGKGDAANPTAPPAHSATESRFSGTIEANETAVAAELGGRVVAVNAAEGDHVVAGQVLAELDAQEIAARKAQAEAAITTAQAELARVTAAPQAARVAQAEAQVKQAEAGLVAARVALANARKLRDNPQELNARINAARGQLKTATTAVDAANAALKAAQVLQESLSNPGSDQEKTRRAIYDQQVAAAEAGVRAAQAQERGARAVLAKLLAIREKPLALGAAVHRAEGEVAKAEAAVGVARAVQAQLQAPPSPEAVAVAEARVAQAQAALAQTNALQDKLKIASPADGTITVQSVHTGEVAQAGQSLFTVADLGRLKLVVYVPTGQIGEVKLGQPVEVTVDAYPGRIFPGQVVRVADQAEFTPKNVQTQKERVKTVFAVEITLANPEGALKAGMPADAVLK